MKVCIKCNQPVSNDLSTEDMCSSCRKNEENTTERLQARIAELELELRKQKTAAEKGDKLLKVMWGDNFNIDSLH